MAAACTKSSMELEQGGEIAVSPIAESLTKAAQSGDYPDSWHLCLWAYHSATILPAVYINSYSSFTTTFLENAEFYYKSDKGAWGGLAEPYFWPGHGSLVFAGYALPAPDAPGTASDPSWKTTAAYDFASNTLFIPDYVQSSNTAETFDLMWFGRTAASYNYRAQGDPVEITFNHALSWITFKVYGDGAPAAAGKEWVVKSLTMNDVNTKGNLKCIGKQEVTSNRGDYVQWGDISEPADVNVFNSEYKLSTTPKEIETVAKGTLVIPQKPGDLTVIFNSGGSADTEKTVSLKLTDDPATNLWEPGVHYTYNLVFKANEILVAPSFGTWEGFDNTITVQ